MKHVVALGHTANNTYINILFEIKQTRNSHSRDRPAYKKCGRVRGVVNFVVACYFYHVIFDQ